MNRRRQRDFFENDRELHPGRLAHGGDLALKKRKIIRPLDPRRPAHITMRSSKAKGRFNMRGKIVQIEQIIKSAAARNRITIHKQANVGNHLHLLLSFKTRESCQHFMREVAGLVARVVTGARKGKPFGKFWDLLAYSRVVTGWRGFMNAAEYVFANRIEGAYGAEARKRFERGRDSS